MGESEWTIRTRATLTGDLPNVVAWWVHPDRVADAKVLYERRGADSVSVETSELDSRRVRIWKVGYPSGTQVVYRVETELGPTGPGVSADGRHVIRLRDQQRVDYPTGRSVTVECENVTAGSRGPRNGSGGQPGWLTTRGGWGGAKEDAE